MAKRLIPLLDRMPVEKVIPSTKAFGGILLFKSASAKSVNSGVVIATGPGGRSKDRGALPIRVKGDAFLLSDHGGNNIKLGERDQVRVRSRDAVGSGRIAAGRLKRGSPSLAMAVHNFSTSEIKTDVWETGLVLLAEVVHVSKAVAALKGGQVIAVPTDTLYGFACDARSQDAIQKIYNIKGRSATKPLAICVADVEDIELYGTVKHIPHGLLGALFPGPVTLILPRGDSSLLDKSLNPGLPSIGVRIPDDPFIRSLCRTFRGALALTSANLSSQPSTVSIDEFKHLWTHCSFVFDAGQLPPGRAGSTIVDLTLPGTFKIVRDGSALRETREVLNSFGLSARTEEKSMAA